MYKHYIITLAALLMVNPAVQAETGQADHKDTAGFGIGALVGGVLGGPIGAVAGAAGGSWLGAREAERDSKREQLADNLATRTAELEQLKSKLAALEAGETAMQTVHLDRRRQTAAELSEALSVAVYFRTDSSELEADTRRRLEKIARHLRDYPQLRIHIAGHADHRGSKAYNQKLSLHRAESVARLLQQEGIDKRRIHTEGHGQSKAHASADDIDAYVFDRRVSIELSLGDPV